MPEPRQHALGPADRARGRAQRSQLTRSLHRRRSSRRAAGETRAPASSQPIRARPGTLPAPQPATGVRPCSAARPAGKAPRARGRSKGRKRSPTNVGAVRKGPGMAVDRAVEALNRPRATPHDTPIPLRAVWRARVFARPCVGATQRSDIARGNQPPACSPPNTAGAAGGRLLLGGGRAAPRRDAASSHRPVRARVRLPGGSAARAPAGARQRLLRGHLPTSAPRAKPAAARRARCAPRPRGRRRGGGWPW